MGHCGSCDKANDPSKTNTTDCGKSLPQFVIMSVSRAHLTRRKNRKTASIQKIGITH